MYLEMDPIGRYGTLDSQGVLFGTVDVDDRGTFTILERLGKGGRGCGRRPLVWLFRDGVTFVAATVASFLPLPLSRPKPRLLLFD